MGAVAAVASGIGLVGALVLGAVLLAVAVGAMHMMSQGAKPGPVTVSAPTPSGQQTQAIAFNTLTPKMGLALPAAEMAMPEQFVHNAAAGNAGAPRKLG